LLLAVVGTLLVALLVTGGRTRMIPVLSREGGIGMLPIALLHVVGPLVLAWLGDRLVRARPTRGGSAGSIAALAFAPVTIGLVAGALALRSAVKALHVRVVGDVPPRIAAEAFGELSNLFFYGDLVSAACGAVVAVVACGAIASIDIEKVAPERTGYARHAWIPVLVSGAGWFIATSPFVHPHIRGSSELTHGSSFWIPCAVMLAVRAARSSAALRSWHDAGEARRHVLTLLIGGIFGVAVPCLLERATFVRNEMDVFWRPVCAHATAQDYRVFFEELVLAKGLTDRLVALHVVLGTLTFGLALAPAIARRRASSGRAHDLRASAAMLVAAIVALAVAGLFAHGERKLLFATVESQWDVVVPKEIQLPSEHPAGRGRGPGLGQLTIDARGEARASYAPFEYPPERLDLAVDKRVTVGQLLSAIPRHAFDERDRTMANPNPMGHPTYTLFTLLVRGARASALPHVDVGEYGSLLGEDIGYFSFVIPQHGWPRTEGWVITARVVADHMQVDRGDGTAPSIVSLSPEASLVPILPRPGQTFAGARLVVSRQETITTVVSALGTLFAAYDSVLASSYVGGGYALVVESSER
jgi:hypothetical protein